MWNIFFYAPVNSATTGWYAGLYCMLTWIPKGISTGAVHMAADMVGLLCVSGGSCVHFHRGCCTSRPLTGGVALVSVCSFSVPW